ncbi:MAG: hypothetical protein ACLFM0_02600 [Spirochaetales bacterium]
MLIGSYYRGKSAPSITAHAWLYCALFVVLSTAAVDAQQLTRAYIRAGEFSEAYDQVTRRAAEQPSMESVARMAAIAQTIDTTSGPMPVHEREHLLRIALEAILDAAEPAGLTSQEDFRDAALELEPILLRFDTYETAQLRRVSMDLGMRMLDSAAWRSALQRHGHALIEVQRDSGGLTDGDTTEEILALVDALGGTGDSRMITLVDRLRRGTRRAEVVRAAREVIDDLDADQ